MVNKFMSKYKVRYKNKNYIIKAGSVKDALSALDYVNPMLQDDRLSPMTYKKLKELGYSSEDWKDLSQEEANKIVQKETSKPTQTSASTQENSKTKQSSTKTQTSTKSIKDYENDLLAKYKLDAKQLPKPPKPLKVPGGEVLWGIINSGADIDINDITNHPLITSTKARLDSSRGINFENDTVNINTPERQKLRKQIADTLASQGSIRNTTDSSGRQISTYSGPVDKKYRAEIVLGPPAGGKSSVIVDKVSSNTNSRVLDSDDAKKLLPEFNNGNGAGLVHEESSKVILEDLIMSQFYKGGKHEGDNVVIPIVGRKPDSAIKYLRKLKEAGYEVHLSFNEVPADVSAKRAVSRFLTTGRFLDPGYIASVGTKPEQTYEYLKQFSENGIQFDSYSKYNNNVKFGEPAKKLEHLDKDKNEIEWEDWQ